jgi:hypothetical protein
MDIQQIVEMLSQMEVNRKADQAKAEAGMKNHMQEIMERLIGSLASDMKVNQAKAEADMKADREETKAKQARMEESPRGELRLTASSIEEKMEAIVHSIRSERDEKIQRWSENVMEWQEIPKEEAAVASLGVKSRVQRNWNLEQNLRRSVWKRLQ